MLKVKKKKYTIDEYINIGKSDIYFYIILTIILFFILLAYIIYNDLPYIFLLMSSLMLLSVYGRVVAYKNLIKIKDYLVQNNLLDKIGDIDYWNESYYFLTDNYMIILMNNIVYSFKYSEIKIIFKDEYRKIGKNSHSESHLNIITNNNKFRVLTYSSSAALEDYEDISDYLIKKNPNIKVEKTVNDTHIDLFTIEKR